MVLLVILKYFDKEAWGECPETFSQLKTDTLEFSLGATKFVTKGLPPSRLLFGRGTLVIPVTSESRNPLDPNNDLSDVELVAKVSWPEERRYAEDELLYYAYAVGSQPEATQAVRGHLPTLIASGSFCTQDRPIIKRKALLSLNGEKLTPRCLRILVFIKLNPIHDLRGLDFMTVWLDCFRCAFLHLAREPLLTGLLTIRSFSSVEAGVVSPRHQSGKLDVLSNEKRPYRRGAQRL